MEGKWKSDRGTLRSKGGESEVTFTGFESAIKIIFCKKNFGAHLQLSSVLILNNENFHGNYAERQVCMWHLKNAGMNK